MKKLTFAFILFNLIGSSSLQMETLAQIAPQAREEKSPHSNPLTACAQPSLSNIEWIIFDVGGVIVTANKGRAFKHIGLLDALSYLIFDRKNPAHLHRRLFDIIDTIDPWEEDTPYIPYDKGVRLPKLLANNWFCSTQNNGTILDTVNERLESAYEQGELSSKREKRLLKKLARMILSPDIIADITVPVPGTADLIHDLSCITDSDGEPCYKLCILSNYDVAAFQAMISKFPDAFAHFTGTMVVSGFPEVQKRKPDPAIYHHLITTLGVDPTRALMIDDEQDNLNTAQTFGIRTVRCDNCNILDVRKQLIDRGILPGNDHSPAHDSELGCFA